MEITENEVKNLAKFAKDGKVVIEVHNFKGEAEKFLDPIEPIEPSEINLQGRVGTIAEFLSKRNHQFKDDACNIVVDLNENIMTFTGNERTEDNKEETVISSKIIETKHFKELEVNKPRQFEALELADYLRFRKNMFTDKEQFSKVWAALSSFEAEIDTQVKEANDKTGNSTKFIKQEVTHNMPRIFDLTIPVFEGVKPIKIEVEVDVNPNGLRCSLTSFDLEEKYEELRASLFEAELDQEIAITGSSHSEDALIELRNFCVVYYG